jgi:hypothetical protein
MNVPGDSLKIDSIIITSFSFAITYIYGSNKGLTSKEENIYLKI